jgi:hypothetical protein
MLSRQRRSFVALCLVACSSVDAAAAGLTPAVSCQVKRLKLAARYAACLLIADSKAVATAAESDRLRCDGKLQQKWASIEAKYGSECPETNPVPVMQDILSTCTADALVAPGSYAVAFRVTNSATLGTLQFHVDYSQAEGEFAGSATFVSCTNAIGGALFAPSDDDVSSLTIGVVSMTPVTAPTDVATCVFSRSSPGLPHPEDFEVVVDLASDPNGVPTLAAVAIDSITPLP